MHNTFVDDIDPWIEENPAQAQRTRQWHKIVDRVATCIMEQTARVTKPIFTNPRDRRTEDYITGRFG